MERLKDIATLDLDKIPIEEIALILAKEKYPDLNAHLYLDRIDEFARRAHMRIGQVSGAKQVIQGLSQYLFEEEGFRGNSSDYYHPANSFFNDVLDRREGIPITLSTFYIAVGRRLGLPLRGVGFPGHFLVRYDDPQTTFFIDCFYRGKILSQEECRTRLEQMYGDQIPFRSEFLEASPHRDILLRMLTNLKIIYMMRKEFGISLQMLNLFLLFSPFGTDELKERGLIHYHMECFGPALKDLESYLEQVPRAEDRPIIEECIEDLKIRVSQIQ